MAPGPITSWQIDEEIVGTVADFILGAPKSLQMVTAAMKLRQALGPGALERPRGSGWRGRWEGALGWGTHVNPWLFHFNV